MKDNEVLRTALKGVLSMCRAEGATRADLKAMVDEVCNHKHDTKRVQKYD